PASISLCANMSRSFSFAVTTATFRPALAATGKTVSARSQSAEFIITSWPELSSKKKLPQMPWTEGGTPVTIEELFTFVKVGMAARARARTPDKHICCRFGINPRTKAASRYSSDDPSRQIATTGLDGHR